MSDELVNKEIKTVPRPVPEIGIDLDNTLEQELITAGSNNIDTTQLDEFTNLATDRVQVQSAINTMCQDSIIQAAIETYVEDTVEKNDSGKVMWAEGNDGKIAQYVNFLLESIGVEKNIYKWAYCLVKYGDVYLRLFRESDVQDDLFTKDREKKKLDEEIKIKSYREDDKYVHYVEMQTNPAEIFELTKFGKTQGYIVAPTLYRDYNQMDYDDEFNGRAYSRLKYRFDKDDVYIYQPTEFVHACLESDEVQTAEEVDIFLHNDAKTREKYENGDINYSYSVRSGTSVLQSVYKIWRQVSLMENAMLLSRLSKSSNVKVISIETGEMPKEQVQQYQRRIKSLIEQKTSLDLNRSMGNYVNPGPVDNTIYVTTRNGRGAITSTPLSSGDTNVTGLDDVDYFKNKLYGALKIPKQYLGDTDDATGFNGGNALSLVSSRYAKTVKRLQAALIQMVTDLINLMLINKGLSNYIRKFTIKMQAPNTLEDNQRTERINTAIGTTRDVLDLLSDIEDNVTRLKIGKALMTNYIGNPEVMTLVQQYIDGLESEQEEPEAGDEQLDEFGAEEFDLGEEPEEAPSFTDTAEEIG